MPLSLNHVSKNYQEQAVIRDLTLSFPEEGVVCLFGASGSGKTTLLRLLCALEAPDEGEVCGAEGKRFSYLFQEDRLLPWLSARENIQVVQSKQQAEQMSADQWLRVVHLGESAAKHPEELSGGMRHRVALARALAFGGDIVLLDEPFQGLDVSLKEEMMRATLTYTAGKLVILVTHSVTEALKMSDEIMVFDGPPLTVRGHMSVLESKESRFVDTGVMNALLKRFQPLLRC